jgi:hypothetical protein
LFDIFKFLEGCIERQPDMTLQELQEQLREVCNTVASTVTIARTLRRRGFIRTAKTIVSCGSRLILNAAATYRLVVARHLDAVLQGVQPPLVQEVWEPD